MKTPTNYLNCLVDDDKELLTSFQPARSKISIVDTGIEMFPQKLQKEISVFIVDDDPMYLLAMEHFLSEEIPSVTIKTFQTGESFLEEMKLHPDIVILDYQLDSEVSSAENGIQILKKIKHIDPDTKVIMLSCQNEIKVAMKCIKHGAADYVAKGENAFVKIKNILLNAGRTIDIVGKIKKHMKIFKIVNFILLVVLILFYIIGHK